MGKRDWYITEEPEKEAERLLMGRDIRGKKVDAQGMIHRAQQKDDMEEALIRSQKNLNDTPEIMKQFLGEPQLNPEETALKEAQEKVIKPASLTQDDVKKFRSYKQNMMKYGTRMNPEDDV